MNISCICGHTAPAEDFCRADLYREFCCPVCGIVFGKKVTGVQVVRPNPKLPPLSVPVTQIVTRPQLELNLK